MPKLKVFVIYDSKIEAYMTPFFSRTAGDALRTWEQTVNSADGKNTIAMYPQDFDLYESAEFDEETGRITQYEALRHLGKAAEMKKQTA